MAVLTQSRPFLDFCHNIGDMSYGISPPPPILDLENSKIRVPCPNETVVGLGEVGKLAGFRKTPVSRNSRPQPTTGRAYISNISFR